MALTMMTLPQVRAIMSASKVDMALVYLLDHPSRDVVLVVLGALVNITADPENQTNLIRDDLDLPAKLVRVVRTAGLRDLDVSCVACKALYNSLLDKGDAATALGQAPFDTLRSTLSELIETAREADSEEIGRVAAGQSVYAQFCEVGEALQRRLEGGGLGSPLKKGMRCVDDGRRRDDEEEDAATEGPNEG
jgi:hypothetical protein